MRRLSPRLNRLWHWLATVAAILQVPTSRAPAQDVLSLLATPEAQEPGPTHRFDFLRDDAAAKYMTYGSLSLRPHFTGSAYYDDNFTLAPDSGGRAIRRDWVWSLSPGLLAGIGEFRPEDRGTFVSLDYTPTLTLYTTHGEFNALDHRVLFDTGWQGSRTRLGLSQLVLTGSGGFVEAGEQVDREIYQTTLTGSYDLSEKTSFDLNGRQIISSYEPGEDAEFALNSRNEWAVEGFVNYQYSDKMKWGGGLTLGWRDIEHSPNEMYEDLRARAAYFVTEKVDVTASAGMRFSQFQGGEDDGPRFVLDLGGSWQAREATALSLAVYRRDESSVAFTAQNFTLTGVRANARQDLGRRWVAGLAAGYEAADYRSTADGNGTGQDYDYWFIGPTLDLSFSEQWAAGVFYQFRLKDSDDSDYGFDNHQVGLRVAFRF